MRTLYLAFAVVVVLPILFLSSCHQDRSAPASARQEQSDDAAKSKQEVTKSFPQGSVSIAPDSVSDRANVGEMSNPAQRTLSSMAAVDNPNDTIHKFIRTANLKFKAKSVVHSTYAIEDAVRQFGGYVAYTHLASNTSSTKTTPVSEDSSLKITTYTVVNHLNLRVPYRQLDTVLKSIAPQIVYLDYRDVKAEDVALSLLANKLKNKRNSQSAERVRRAADAHARKSEDIAAAEEFALNAQEGSDDAYLENLRLEDNILYSTIDIDMYQEEQILSELVARERELPSYSAPFGEQFLKGLRFGWLGVQNFLIVLAHIWEILLALGVGIIVFRWFLRRTNTTKKQSDGM